MKKNAMMKIAAILMVAVLLTTCAISSTFAKYVTSAADDATARVAKWNVEVETTLDGLFAETRVENGKTLVASVNANDGDEVLDCVVAPGMSGKVETARKVTGTPEVAIEVKTVATVELKGWGTYCPLVFKVGNVELTQKLDDATTTDINEYESVDKFAERIADAIGADVQQYEAGHTLTGTLDVSEISWSWAFEKDAAQNEIDTAIAKAGTAEIKIELETVVSQIEAFN